MEEIQEKLEIIYNYQINFIVHNSKNENKIGYFKTELVKLFPLYFNDKKRTTALISLCSILIFIKIWIIA